MAINIEWTEQDINIQADMSRLTWDDIVALQRAPAQSNDEAMEMLRTIVTKVTGQPAGELPAMAVTSIVRQIQERAIGGGTAAKN